MTSGARDSIVFRTFFRSSRTKKSTSKKSNCRNDQIKINTMTSEELKGGILSLNYTNQVSDPRQEHSNIFFPCGILRPNLETLYLLAEQMLIGVAYG